MNNELKPVQCGCGGEARTGKIYGYAWTVECTECGIQSGCYDTEAEAIQAWNRAMGSTEKSSTVERTTKVKESWGLAMCCACEKRVFPYDNYCSHCGARLEWK
jgi:hypothetical protein